MQDFFHQPYYIFIGFVGNLASFKDNHRFSSNSAGDLFGMVKQPFQRLLVASNSGIKLGHGLKHVVVCCLLCFSWVTSVTLRILPHLPIGIRCFWVPIPSEKNRIPHVLGCPRNLVNGL